MVNYWGRHLKRLQNLHTWWCSKSTGQGPEHSAVIGPALRNTTWPLEVPSNLCIFFKLYLYTSVYRGSISNPLLWVLRVQYYYCTKYATCITYMMLQKNGGDKDLCKGMMLQMFWRVFLIVKVKHLSSSRTLPVMSTSSMSTFWSKARNSSCQPTVPKD